jgi:hypothetical protein
MILIIYFIGSIISILSFILILIHYRIELTVLEKIVYGFIFFISSWFSIIMLFIYILPELGFSIFARKRRII